MPLSARERANGRAAEISLCTRTGACTDISALACTAKNSVEVSAVWESHSQCGHPARRMVSEEAGSGLEGPATNDLASDAH